MQQEHATGANQTKKRFDKRTADAKPYSVGDYVWVFQEVVPSKRTKKLLKKMAWSRRKNKYIKEVVFID